MYIYICKYIYIYIYICIYIYMYYVCVLNNCMQCEQQTLRSNFDMRSLNYWYRCYNTTLPHFARLKFKGTSLKSKLADNICSIIVILGS